MLQLLIVVGRALALGLRGHRELVLENLALRQQLMAMKRANSRPRLQARDRLFWIALRRIWTNWRTAVVIVRPETVVGWHRTWLRRRWTRRSTPRASGRPPIPREIRSLVREMASANPLWGAPRIHGELRTLGVGVSERTVSRLLTRLTRPPSQTWRTFLTNHLVLRKNSVPPKSADVPVPAPDILGSELPSADDGRSVTAASTERRPASLNLAMSSTMRCVR